MTALRPVIRHMADECEKIRSQFEAESNGATIGVNARHGLPAACSNMGIYAADVLDYFLD